MRANDGFRESNDLRLEKRNKGSRDLFLSMTLFFSTGYNRVVTFPRGATHIVVRQTPLQARDDNYLGNREGGKIRER